MNKAKQKKLKDAYDLLNTVDLWVDNVLDKEQDALNNYPENLQGGDVYMRMENAVDSMQDAKESIREAQEYIMSAINGG